jgi:manganese oxidase
VIKAVTTGKVAQLLWAPVWLGLCSSIPMRAGAADSSADSALQAAALHAKLNAIAPTVTVAMGDVGGKFFGRTPDPAKTRHYYVAAELEAWDFAPQGRDVICGRPLPPQVIDAHSAIKIRYIQYTDETFTSKLIPNPRLGVLGPVLRGIVGQDLMITFLNQTELPLSMHPHGVKYDKDSEGAYYQPKPGLGAAVGAHAKFTYVWHLDEASGPLPGEPSSKCWLYHSHVSGDAEVNLGLVGFIIVTDPRRARPDGTPNDVDREMASLFMIFNESGFNAEDEEAAEAAKPGDPSTPNRSWSTMQVEREQGARYAINGCIFGNLPGLEMNEGERVRWYLFGLGDENDMHTAHWHGLRVVEEGRRRTDVVELLPATMKVADMVADNPGSWLFHCHVAEHMREGMFARVVVHPREASIGRAPEAAFFGLRQAEQSLQIDRAEATLDFTPNSPQPCEIRLHGTVTVSAAFSVFTAPIRLQLGDQAVTFKPATDGNATADRATYRAINSSRYGVVYGGLMEFEAKLTGPDWLDELKKLGVTSDGPRTVDIGEPVQMRVGESKHTASIRLIVRPK